jgi:SAM-dependent methyltransferase
MSRSERRLGAALDALAGQRVTTSDLDELRTWLHNLAAGLEESRTWNHELSARIVGLERQLDPIDAFVSASRATPDWPSIGLTQFEEPDLGRVVGYRADVVDRPSTDAYLAFEDVFRLSEETIRERQRPYLSLLGDRQPVVDIGCGRGEFLELLRDAGIPAVGVDLNRGMVARARAKGVEVHQGNGIDYLGRCEDASWGAVFAAQVVEHLAYDELIAFLRTVARKLRSNGLLIVETVNPHAPGALKNFWFDPSHHHPVFPEVLLTLCRASGFNSAYVFHPGGRGDVEHDRERVPDYALVAGLASSI